MRCGELSECSSVLPLFDWRHDQLRWRPLPKSHHRFDHLMVRGLEIGVETSAGIVHHRFVADRCRTQTHHVVDAGRCSLDLHRKAESFHRVDLVIGAVVADGQLHEVDVGAGQDTVADAVGTHRGTGIAADIGGFLR